MGRQALREDVEGLPVDRVDRHLRSAEQARIIERSYFQNYRIEAWPPRGNVSAACVTEFARNRSFQIAARKGFRHAPDVAEPLRRHQHEHVGCAAADVLTFAAVALRAQARLAFGDVSNFSAIASAFEHHLNAPRVM